MSRPLEEFVQELLARLGLPEADVAADQDARKGSVTVLLELEGRDLQEVVEALNHLAARYAEKAGMSSIFFDINGYRAEREELIIRLAQAAAEKVRRTGGAVELPSMNSYERRIVHGYVGDAEDVESESIGRGKERRVTIRKKP